MASEIGKAYLVVLPQLDSDFESTLGALVGGISDIPVMLAPELSGDVGDEVGQQVDQAGPAVTAKAVALGSLMADAISQGIGKAFDLAGALPDLGLQFHRASAILRVGTGEVGAELDNLNEIARNIYAASPAALDDISQTVSLAHTRLGLVGDDLQTVSTRIVTLSRITGSDLPTLTDNVTGMFNQWDIGADQQEGSLDKILRVSQATGIGVTDLTGQLNGAGLQLQALGFTFDDSIALIGNLNKGGLDLSVTTAAFRKALSQAAKDGKPANEVFQETFDAIKNAPDDTAAAGIAFDLFGARGIQMAQAIRNGSFAYEDLSAQISDGGDTIQSAGTDVSSFASKWEILKHKAEIAFEPIASGLTDTLTDLGAFAGDVWTTFQNEGWDAAWDKITAKADLIWDGDPTTGSEGIHQKLNRFLSNLPGWAIEAAGKLGEAGLALFDGAVHWAEGVWDGDPDTGREGLSTKLNRAIDSVPAWVTDKTATVGNAALNFIDSMTGWADKLWDGDADTGKEGLHAKLNRLTDPDGSVITWISQQPTRLAENFRNWIPSAVEWAGKLWDGDPDTGREGIHQALDRMVDNITAWADEQSGDKMAKVGEKLIGGMIAGSFLALATTVNLWRNWMLSATKILITEAVPWFFELGHSLGSAMLRGLVGGFLDDMPGPLKTLLESAPTIGPLITEMEAAADLLEHHDRGGIVGGPRGAPRLVVAHGGETILPTHRMDVTAGLAAVGAGGSGPMFNVTNYITPTDTHGSAREAITRIREMALSLPTR